LLDGVPAGLGLALWQVDRDLARRQAGYGRGGRMLLESDRVSFLAGVRHGKTLGSPIALMVENKDYENWREAMSPSPVPGHEPEREVRPRPGHGDFAGMLKFDTDDARNVLERASARETAARVATGAVARVLLEAVAITVRSRVIRIGEVTADLAGDMTEGSFMKADDNILRCPDEEASARMVAAIDAAGAEGDTLGGVFEVCAFGVMPGLGSYAQHDFRLDGRLFAAMASIPAIKGVEAGSGFDAARERGSSAHDEIVFSAELGAHRETNRAGGLEAGMSNGEPVLLRAAMKPIPSLARPLSTVDMDTLEPAVAFKERADVCAVPAAAVVGEAAVALVLADALLDKFGGDTVSDLLASCDRYLERIARVWLPRKHP